MLKSFYTKVLNAGIKDGQPEYLQKKIKLTNKLIAVLLFFVTLPFFIVTLLIFVELWPILVTANLLLSLLIVFNFYGLEKISRVVLSILPISILILFNVSATLVLNNPPVPTPLMAIVFALFPFILFDLRERRYMIATSIVTILMLLWFDRWAAIELAFEGYIVNMVSFSSTLACIIGIAMFYTLVNQNRISEEKAEVLIREMGDNNNLLNQSQDELKHKLDELEIARKEEKKRNWTSEGLAQFGDMLRSDKDLVNLSDEVLSKLVKYINANQGGLYSVMQDNNETYIELISSYAYNQKKFNEKRIEIGQGLLGQTYKEKSYKYLSEVPQGYMEITSGLGDATLHIC